MGNDTKYRKESAKMLATILHGMQGTPYIYQGEEIGMTNVKFALEDYKDVETINMVREKQEAGWSMEKIMKGIYAKGRDNARTPIQWSDELFGGFSEHEPWIKMNPNYPQINVAQALADEDSVFYYYQKLIRLRKELDIISTGDFHLLFEDDRRFFAYTREADGECLTVIANFTDQETELNLEDVAAVENGTIIISNYKRAAVEKKMVLQPYESFMILKTESKKL